MQSGSSVYPRGLLKWERIEPKKNSLVRRDVVYTPYGPPVVRNILIDTNEQCQHSTSTVSLACALQFMHCLKKKGLGKLPQESALQNDPDYRELRVIPVILFANNLTTGAVVVGHQVLKSSELGDAHLKSSQT